MKKILFIIIFIGLGFLFFWNSQKSTSVEKEEKTEKETIYIATCPTFYHIENLLKESDINIVKTNSTLESINLLERGFVDFVISGRALKKEEPNLLFEILGAGYDFIYKDEIVIYQKDMENFIFYTNLDKENILRDFEYILEENLIEVEDVLDYLNEGIVITILENKLESNIVNIINNFNQRVRLSRLPRLYYVNDFKSDKIEEMKKDLKDI